MRLYILLIIAGLTTASCQQDKGPRTESEILKSINAAESAVERSWLKMQHEWIGTEKEIETEIARLEIQMRDVSGEERTRLQQKKVRLELVLQNLKKQMGVSFEEASENWTQYITNTKHYVDEVQRLMAQD